MPVSGKGKNTAAAAEELVAPYAEELGLSVWDVKFVKEGASWYLRVFIDKPGGVDINDCELLSRAIDQPLDDADLISQSYYLEVSSPGIERELCRAEHFDAMMGREVTVKLIRPREGRREFVGVLSRYENGAVTVETDGDLLTFEKADISNVRLYEPIEFQ